MSYHTAYSVSWSGDHIQEGQVIDVLVSMDCSHNTKDPEYDREFWQAVFSGEICTWYDHDKDMCRVSAQFPGMLFILEGAGEESGDLWRVYYRDGQMQQAITNIRYSDFDETKLTDPS